MRSRQSYNAAAVSSRSHRSRCRAARRCINGPLPTSTKPAHGAVVKAGKCQSCIDTHKESR